MPPLPFPRHAFRILVLCCLVAASLRGQSTATLTVNATQAVRTVDERMFGINAVLWDGSTSDQRTIDLVKAADLRFIRIPGGSLSDEYHWKVNRTGSNTWTWAAGMNNFAALVTAVNAQVTAVVNYGSGTPEEAAAWVAYANASAALQGTSGDVPLGTDSKGENWQTAGYWSKLRVTTPLGTDDGSNFLRLNRAAPIGIKYWEIGNENYGASWEFDEQPVRHDPYTYAVRARDYIAKMKAVDPTIKIAVVVVPGEDQYANNTSHPATNPRTKAVHNGWTPVLLTTLKSLGVTPDALVYHRYEQAPGRESDATLLQAAKTWPADAADLRQQLTDYLGAAGAAVELVVTENNSVYSDPGKQSTSLVDGLFYADALGNILQTEFNSFAWWTLRNGPLTTTNLSASLYGWRQYGDYGILASDNPALKTTAFDPHPTYYVMKLASHFARGGDTIVKAASNNPLLAVYAARRTNGTLTLLVINKSPTDDIAATIGLTGFTPKAAAAVYSYGIPQDEAARTGTGSPDVATSTLNNAATSFTQTFPRYSATVVTLAASAPEIIVPPAGATTSTGANVALTVVATGAQPLTYQWYKGGVAVAGATAATLALPAVTPANAGSYSVRVTDVGGAPALSAAVTLTVGAETYTPPASTLVNISTRAQVGVGDKVMIAGVSIGGAGAKRLLIRAVGPTLGGYGVSGTLVDPQLEIRTLDDHLIASNDDWYTNDAAALSAAGDAAGAFPLNPAGKDAALIVTLPVGAVTAIVRGANQTTGLALVEVYDLDTTSASRLINISTRALVGTGEQAMIAGFAVRGSAPRKVLARAVGPWLSQYLSGALLDPQLTVKKQSDGTVAATNDDWGTPDGATIAAITQLTGAFPLENGSKDAALVTSLSAGLWTPFVEGKAGATGVALVEVYEAP